MSITSAIIISGDLIIESGQTSAGLLIETLDLAHQGNVFIENGGTLEDSIVTSQGMITVEPGGLLQRTDVEEDAFIVIDGTAEEITARNAGLFQVYAGGTLKNALLEAGGNGVIGAGALATSTGVDGGYFMLYGGSGENTVVSSGGSFVVQMDSNSVVGKSVKTTVLSGGIMRLTSAGTAEETTISGGFLEVLVGSASGTILSGGSMRVDEGNTVQNTTLDGGKMELIGATALATVVNSFAEVKAVSASTIQDLTMNGGALNAEGGAITSAAIDSGAFLSVSYALVHSLTMDDEFSMFFADSSEMNEIVINGGTGSFTGVSVNGFTAGSAAIVSLDEASMLSGKAVFADGATVSLTGATIAFDTAVATETEAQIQGLSAVTGDAVYTLNAAPEIGIYLLATGAPADFDNEVVLNGSTVSLQVNTPLVIGELVYTLNLDDTGDLSFSIEENVTPSLAFVNSEWSDLEPGATVPVGGVTATIGTNAFATGDEAVTALAGIEDPKIRIAGGTAAFSAPITIYTTVYKGAEIISPDVAAAGKLVVNSGATVSGSATFEKGASITINGKVLFDTACASAESAQYVLNDTLEGTTTFELKFAKADPGVYLLLSGLSSFEDPVTFGDYTLEVGAAPVTTGGRIYQLSFADDDLVLTVEKDTSPTPTVVYVNSEWQDIYKEGDSIKIDDETFAVFGYDAFLDGDAAVSFIDGDTSVSRDLVFLSGGTLSSMVGFDSFTLDPDYLVTLDGEFTGTAITINAAGFDGFTRRVLIAGDGFGEILPAVTVVGEGFSKEFLDDGKTLLVTSNLVEDTYANAQWTGEDVKDQFVGDMALVWEQNAFSSFKAAADAMREAGYTIYLTGGTSAEDIQTKFANDVVITANTTGTGANSITGMDGGVLTVESGFTAATVAGFSVLTVRAGFLDGELVSFGSVTVTEGLSLAENGALHLDLTDYKPENAALVNGLFHLTDTQTCTLTITDDQPMGVYHLATGAAGFAKTVSIDGSTITLTVGAAPVRDGDTLRTFQLSLTEANELELTIAKYRPPLGYVNSEWAELEDGTPVTIGETTATIGFDAFATLAPAIAAVTEDGAVEIVGGEVSFAEGYSKTITVDAGATVIGKAVFDKPITIDGTIAFDIANATAEAAQFGGFSFITGSTATAYTLTAAAPAVGTYLLATDAAAFDSAVKFGPGILTVGAGAAVIGSYTYALTLNEGTLALTIEDYIPPTPTYDLIYVNSKWASLPSGSTVAVGDKTAVIGEDAFSSGDVAIANVTADGAVEVVGSEVYFTNPISKSVTVDAGATLVGRAAFTTAITVNGTVAFDTQYATEANAQFTGFSFISGNAAYTLTDTAKTAGVYLLATDAAAFASAVKFGNATLSVGAEATVIGDFTYALTLNEGVLALTVEEFVPPTPVYDLVYANSEWAALPTGSTVTVGDKTAVIGEDAFASGDAAILNVTSDGMVEVVGGEVFFTNPVSKSVTIDADATLIGKNTFSKAITVDGTVGFDTQYATADDAQFKGFSFVTGSTTTAYTLTDAAPAAGIYLLATDAASFASAVAFRDVILTVGAEAVPVGDFTYALSLNEGSLVLTVEDYIPPVPVLAYVNSDWADLEDGTHVQISETVTATIGYDAFAALAPAIAGVTEDGAVEVVGGEVSFSDGYSKTITVDAEATVVGTAVFDQAITINGTVAFDTDFATAEDAQFKGFSFVSGTATYTLTDSVKAAGTYLLATGVEAFTDTVAFDDVTLTVGAEAVPVGDFTYALTLNEGTLALTVEDYIPPTPALAYVNSEWSELEDGTPVQISETVTAVIGYDAFAELAPAIAAVTDDGAVEIAGGTVSFAKGYSKTITVDADATVVGNGSFKTPVTVNGTIAFDTQYATAYLAQYTTFSNIVGSASYTLTDSVKAAGTYQLATGAKGFKGDIKLSVYTLKVGGSARRVGNFTYAVSLMGGSLSLTVAKAKAPSSRPKLVYVNSAWADMNDGTLVKVDSTTYATLGKDAFADGDTATSIVSPKGEIRIVGGSAAFTDNTHNVTVSSGAVLDLATEVTLAGATVLAGGAMTAGFGAVVDGLTLAGDGAAAAVVSGGTVVNASISESATITVSNGGLVQDATVDGSARINVSSGGLAEGIGLSCGENEEEHGFLVVGEGGSASGITVYDGGSLTTDNGSFLTSAVIFGGQTNVGGTATRVTLYDAMNVTGWGEVSKARVSSGGIISTFHADGVGSVLDSEILSGGIVRNAGFVSEMQVLYGGTLETGDGGIAESTEVQSGGLFIVSGSGAEASGLSLVEGATVTITDGAKLTGRVTAGSGATIGMDDGTALEFDLSVLARPADYVLVNDFSAIDGTPDLVITVSDAQEGGTYLLAGGAASFDRGITLGEYTLTLESEPVVIGSSTFSLNLSDDGVLSLLIDVPVFYVNSEWADLEDGTPVTIDEETVAVIGIDAFATGDAAAAASPASAEIRVVGGTVTFTDGILKQTVIRSGVELTNTDVYATLTIEEGAVLSGKSVFGTDSAVFGEGQIVFDTANMEEGQPQFAGLSRIEGSPAYVLAPGATTGEYLFAADAANMLYQGIQVADGVTAYVGRAEFPVLKNEEGDQLSYVFDVTKDNDLVLSVVKVRNELDNGWNNYVYDKKAKVLNPWLDSFVSTALEDGVKGVLLDEKGTVFSDGRRNYAGGIKGGVTDEYDYAKITLEKGAKLSFNLESTGAGKFTVWQLVEGTDKKGNVTYTMKSLLATSLKKDKNTGLYAATTKDLLIEADGDYYISMQATEAASKKGGYAFYNVELNYTDDRTHFFVDGDDGWNDYVYDTKQDNPLNPAAADGDLLVNTVAKAGDAVQLDSPGTEFQLDNKTLTNFAGFGDDTDYAKIALPYDSALAFNVTATDAAKFTIWQLVVGTDKKGNVTYKMKLIQTTALKKDKNTGLYSAETALRRFNLDDGNEYYVSVQATNAKKGGSAFYSIVTSDESLFYTDADNGWNDYVYDKKREEPLNMAVYGSVGTLLYKQMGDIQIDTAGTVSKQVGVTTFTNYVGFGDDADYLKITLENTSKLSFNVTATNASKFVIYQLVEGTDKKGNATYTMKVIQSTALKKADKYAAFYTVANGTKTTKDLAAGDYYIAVVSTNAKKGELVYYNVSLNDAGCSGLPDKPVEPENFPPAPDETESGTDPQTEIISTGDPDELTGFDAPENTLNIHQPAANAPSYDLSAAAVADIQESKSAWQAMLA